MKKEYTVTVKFYAEIPVKFVFAESVKQAELQGLKYVRKMLGLLPGHWHQHLESHVKKVEEA
jgi:hypothetical protein